MGALAARGAQVLRTDRLGTIVVRTDGVALSVQLSTRAWDLPAP
jgi:beta-lactamase superfamily II metal-dependent hydrolase